MTDSKDSIKNTSKDHDHTRRSFMKRSTTGLASAAFAASVPTAAFLASSEANASDNDNKDAGVNNSNLDVDVENSRATQVRNARVEAARLDFNHARSLPIQESNNDESRYSDQHFYGNITKALPHNQYGEVDPVEYTQLLKALETQKQSDFNVINLATGATRKLANPQGSDRFPLIGMDGHATRMPKAPTFRSKTTAAEMGELYWLALTRDVDFNDYGSNPDIANAITDLNNFSQTVGPKQAGQVTTSTIFRGETADDMNGNYISQFLIKDVPYGPSLIEQKYNSNTAGQDFMTDNATWLAVQNGSVTETASIDPAGRRYIHNNRSLGEYVHGDALFQAYFNASLIMLGSGGPFDSNNPYLALPNEGAFTTFGGPMVFDLLTQSANLALQGAWYHKWQVHRRLRPEEFAGRVHHKMVNNRDYEIDSEILNSAALAQVVSNTGSHFLPMAYVEGSPTHPAYPAGHSTVAGACSTVLKALFDESALISSPEEVTTEGTVKQAYTGSDTLTLGGEINKLAANITLGRDAAGVHYRSDGIEGLVVGEQQAIGLLRDYSITLHEQFDGFQFTKFDGTSVVIRNGQILS